MKSVALEEVVHVDYMGCPSGTRSKKLETTGLENNFPLPFQKLCFLFAFSTNVFSMNQAKKVGMFQLKPFLTKHKIFYVLVIFYVFHVFHF